MSALNHENIVNLLGCCFTAEPSFVIVEPTRGDLKTILRQARPRPGVAATVTFAQQLTWLRHITAGVNYLFSARYMHRDLGMRSVYVTDQNVAKVATMSLIRSIHQEDYAMRPGQGMVPVRWMVSRARAADPSLAFIYTARKTPKKP